MYNAHEQAADAILSAWADSSNSHNQLSNALQSRAQELFGLKGKCFTKKGMDRDVGRASADVLDASLVHLYTTTQEHLKKAGISEVTVYRGMGGLKGVTMGKVKGLKVQLQPLSSFSTDLDTAFGFAYGNPDSGVLETTIPAERIVGIAATGLGCLSEYEVVVAGGTYKSNVAHPGDAHEKFY